MKQSDNARVVRSMLNESGLDSALWGEAVAYANHSWDRIMTTASDGDKRSPWEQHTRTKLKLKSGRACGCLVMSYITRPKRKGKVAERAWSGILFWDHRQTVLQSAEPRNKRSMQRAAGAIRRRYRLLERGCTDSHPETERR